MKHRAFFVVAISTNVTLSKKINWSDWQFKSSPTRKAVFYRCLTYSNIPKSSRCSACLIIESKVDGYLRSADYLHKDGKKATSLGGLNRFV